MTATTSERWHNVYITDKSGRKRFNITASPMAKDSEVRNLTRKLEAARINPAAYHFLDVESAVVMVDGEPVTTPMEDRSDEDLLADLGL